MVGSIVKMNGKAKIALYKIQKRRTKPSSNDKNDSFEWKGEKSCTHTQKVPLFIVEGEKCATLEWALFNICNVKVTL